MGYNKRQFQKTNDKKVLHKVRKHWVVVSLAMLMALGGGALATHTASANADATNANNGNNVNNTQSVKENLNAKLQSNQINANQNNANANTQNNAKANQNSNQNVNSNAIQQQAEALHNEILGNAAQHPAANNANNNNASQSNQNASAQQQPSAQGRQAAPQVNNNGVKANVPSHNGFGAVKLGNPNDANLKNNQVAINQNSDKTNAPKRLLGTGDGGSASTGDVSSNGNSDSHVVSNSSDQANIAVKYVDQANGQVVDQFEQSANPGTPFDIQADRGGGQAGYHYVAPKGTIPGVDLVHSSTIPFPAKGTTYVINFQVAKNPASSKVPSKILYVYQDASNHREINQLSDVGNSGDPISNPQGFLGDLPTGYTLNSVAGSNPTVQGMIHKNGNTYTLPTTLPTGIDNQVFIYLNSIAKPMANSEIEYVDEGNGQIVGNEEVSGQNGQTIRNFNNFKKFVPSGYTFDSSNNANNYPAPQYTQGAINYLYVKSNTPDDKTNGYVNVIFKDKISNKIIDQNVMSGKVGSDVDTSQGTISGMVPGHYRFDSADPSNPQVTKYGNNLQNLTYYVSWDGSNIPSSATESIDYVDYKNPSTSYGTENIEGKPSQLINWQQYTTVLPQNTQFVSMGQHDSRFVDGNTSYVYVKHVSTNAQPITVNFINQHGAHVASDKVTGAYGKNFSDITKVAAVPQGYNLKDNKGNDIQQNLNYTIGSDAQTINVFVNGDQYTVPLTIHRNINGKPMSDTTASIKGRVGDTQVLSGSDYNPDKQNDLDESKNQTVTMGSRENADKSLSGVLNPGALTFNYQKTNYNAPGYDPQDTPSDNGTKSDYTPSDTKAYPSDNPVTGAVQQNGSKVASGYTPAWIPKDPTKPNGQHTNGYVPNDHIPKGYVPGYVPNGQGGYVPGYVDPNNLPSGSKNGNGKNNTVPKYVAGVVPSGQNDSHSYSGLVPAGSITVHYINNSDQSHISSDTISGQPNANFDLTNYVNNLPSGYAVKSVDYGTDNYNNQQPGTKITKFSGNDQDVNIMLNKMATATLDYVNSKGETFPGMSRTLNGVSGSKIKASDYENYLPLGYVLDPNQPNSSANNDWKLANGATYQIVVDHANVTPAKASDGYGTVTLNYVDTQAGDPRKGEVIATIKTAGKSGKSFKNDYNQDYQNASDFTVDGYSDTGWDNQSAANNLVFDKNNPQTLQVDLKANGTPTKATQTEKIYYIDSASGQQVAKRTISGKNGARINWAPYEEYLPSTDGTYYSFDRLGMHNVSYNGGSSYIYLHKANRVHVNAVPGYDPDSTHNANSDYFAPVSANNNPYQSDDPSDADLAQGRAAANYGHSDGGVLPAHYVAGWVPVNASQPNGAHMSGYIPSDDIPQGYIPGQVPNGRGSYVNGYVPSDVNNQPAGSTNGTKTVPKYVPGTVSDGTGHKVPGMVPSSSSVITVHYINADSGNKDFSDVSLNGSIGNAFNVAQYQNNLPQGYSYIQTNYGSQNPQKFDISGTTKGTPVAKYTDNGQDVYVMLHRTNSATINFVDQNGASVATKSLNGKANATINKSDFTDFLPYGYSLNTSNPTEGTWKYDDSADQVNLVKNSDAPTTPSDNKKNQDLGYINLVYRDSKSGQTISTYATAHANGTSFSQSDGTDMNAFEPSGYTATGYADPNVATLKYEGGQVQNTVVNVSRASDGSGSGQPAFIPKNETDTIQYVDADNDSDGHGHSLQGQTIASTTLTGAPGTEINYGKYQSKLPSAYGGNWAYDFMGTHDKNIAGRVDTIYIHKAQPAQQYGLVNIKYVDAKTNQTRGTDSIYGDTGSQFDITKYENNIPDNGTTQSDQWTFNRASDVPNFFNSDVTNGQNMTVYVNEPVAPKNYGSVTVNFINSQTGQQVGSPTTITGTDRQTFDPTSFENDIPSGYSYNTVTTPIYNFIAGQNQTMNVKIDPQG